MDSDKGDYGPKDEVRSYARDKSILKLIDDLVDELLKAKPSQPEEHLAQYLLRRGTGGSPSGTGSTCDVDSLASNTFLPLCHDPEKGLEVSVKKLYRHLSSSLSPHNRLAHIQSSVVQILQPYLLSSNAVAEPVGGAATPPQQQQQQQQQQPTGEDSELTSPPIEDIVTGSRSRARRKKVLRYPRRQALRKPAKPTDTVTNIAASVAAAGSQIATTTTSAAATCAFAALPLQTQQQSSEVVVGDQKKTATTTSTDTTHNNTATNISPSPVTSSLRPSKVSRVREAVAVSEHFQTPDTPTDINK